MANTPSRSGQVVLDKKAYHIIQEPSSYKVTEVPSHFDIDPRMERRVIYNSFSQGVTKRREQNSTDAASASPYNRQTTAPEGFWWANGCDTRLADRILSQRATTVSNYSSAEYPMKFGDLLTPTANYSWLITQTSLGGTQAQGGSIYYQGSIGAWTRSFNPGQTFADLSITPSDAITFNNKLYVGMQASGTAAPYWTWDGASNTGLWTNGNASTTATNAANTGQNTITFTSAPSGFANGQTIILDTGVNNETAVLSTGAGTTTWTLTANLTHGHSQGFRIQGVGGGSQNPTGAFFTSIRNQLWRASGPSIYSSLDGLSWSGATAVGDPAVNITGLDVYEDFLYVFKPDGVYTADRAGNVYPVYPGFRNLGINPRPIGQWRGSYYFAADIGMIWEVNKETVNRIGFDLAEPYPMANNNMSIPNVAKNSRGVGLPNFLVIPFTQVSGAVPASYFLAWDGKGWHPFEFFGNLVNQTSGSNATSIGLTNAFSVFGTQLQFAFSSSNFSQVNYMTNVLIDPFLAASYDTNAQVLYLNVDNGVIEDEDKVLERVNCDVDYASTGTVRIAFATDEKIASLTYTDLGAPVEGDLQFFQRFQPPVPYPKYKKITLRLTITPTFASGSPMVRNIVIHYKQRGPQRRTWDISLLAESNIIGSSGRADPRNAKKIINDLDNLRQKRQPVQFQDIIGRQTWVYVDEVGEEMKIFRPTTGLTSVSYVVPIKLVEVTST